MPVAKPESSDSRVIAHIDMDCFYVQVEQRKQPQLRGLPTAVVQYNSWKGGGLIAVSYEARKFGVKRSMRGDEAKQVCPQIHLVQVPVARGKADLNLYRNAGSEVVSILARKCLCERASIDEVYLDLSDAAERMLAENPPENLESIDEEALKSHILGLNEDGNDAKENVRKWLSQRDADHRNKLLACAAVIVAELRMQVLKETAFTCSAGVAHNKMLAKLASGMNKPAQQTIVPFSSVGSLLGPLPIKKMKQLGGKLGDSLQTDLGVSTVGNLLQFSEEKLQERYGINTGTWLWNIARGISGEEVQERLLPNSHGSGKTFPGPQALRTIASVQCWLNELCEELNERLCSDFDQNKRIARTLTLHARAHKGSDSYSQKNFPSKSCPLRYGILKLQEDTLTLFQTGLREYLDSFGVKSQGSQQNEWRITGLSVSATKIVAIPSGTSSITKYFHGQALSPPSSKQSSNRAILNIGSMSPPGNEDHLEVYIPETQMDLSDVDTTIKCVLPTRSKQVERINDQDSSSKRAMQYWCQNGPSPLSTSESVSSLKWNLPEPKGDLLGEGTDIKYSTSNVARHKQKRNMLQDKAAPSILRFVHRFDSLQQEPERAGVVHEDRAFDPSGACCSAANSSTYSGSHALEQNKQRMETWKYKVDDIDPTVVNELPPEIQEEIRAWIRPQKRPGIAKRGSSIAHYFLPNKNL